jgi:hypothetical protein
MPPMIRLLFENHRRSAWARAISDPTWQNIQRNLWKIPQAKKEEARPQENPMTVSPPETTLRRSPALQ